jgi:hypothetical protein
MFDRIVNCAYFWDVSGGEDNNLEVKGPSKVLYRGSRIANTRFLRNNSQFPDNYNDEEVLSYSNFFTFMKAVFPRNTHATNPLLGPNSPNCLKGIDEGAAILDKDFEID